MLDRQGPRPRRVVSLANKLLYPFPPSRFDPERIVEAACKRTGLPAPAEATFHEGLSQLCYSLENEARLSPIGRYILKQNVAGSVVNRMQVEEWHRQHPELDETINKPLIIVGLPRTGTTLLSNLLDLDPQNRSLYQWQTDAPAPPPELADYREDKRIAETARRIDAAAWLAPKLQAAHPTVATHPCECFALWEHDFRSMGHEMLADLPTYRAWRDQDDMRSAYRYHKRVLQMFQHTLPTGTWSLKTPCHLWALPALMETYPDATLIFTHRDLAKVIPSISSVARTMRNGFSDEVNCSDIGSEWVHKVETALARAADYENQRGSDAFLHIQYQQLIDDPVAVVESIYQNSGREMTDLLRRRIRYWVQHPPADKHGKHHYSAEDFGLTDTGIREQFADYYSRYNVAIN